MWWAFALVVAALAFAPLASGQHCDTKINVYGRISLAPIAPPPYMSTTQGMCLRVFNDGVVNDHSLPPNTDQVMVRVNGDFGSSIGALSLKLDGLGFQSQGFTLFRTANQFGGFTYNLPEWVPLPEGPMDGTLTATVVYPGGLERSVTYHTTFTPPPPPALPPV